MDNATVIACQVHGAEGEKIGFLKKQSVNQKSTKIINHNVLFIKTYRIFAYQMVGL